MNDKPKDELSEKQKRSWDGITLEEANRCINSNLANK
jgi:hypothetical protein